MLESAAQGYEAINSSLTPLVASHFFWGNEERGVSTSRGKGEGGSTTQEAQLSEIKYYYNSLINRLNLEHERNLSGDKISEFSIKKGTFFYFFLI